MTYEGHRDQRFGHVTYAQHADDLMILNLFDLIGTKLPTYLDIGAHHPTNISNTKLLYDRGSRGVNVEANSHLILSFFRERPEDINLCRGVALDSGMQTFFMYGETSGRNTFSLDEVDLCKAEFGAPYVRKVDCVTLDFIVQNYCNGRWPDLLNVDIEGLDKDILRTAPFDQKNGPQLVVVETRRKKTWDMIDMMQWKGFNPYCRMGENLFFVRADLFKRCF